MTFKEKFNILEEVDFYDIQLDKDNKKFIDPFRIHIGKDDFHLRCADRIQSFFENMLDYAHNNDLQNGYRLTQYLQENNETNLGYSKGKPGGKGFGPNSGKLLFDVIRNSEAMLTGKIKDIFDASIMIPNVDKDKISDLTTNLILEELIVYTQEQCEKYNIPMSSVDLRRPVWIHGLGKWKKIKSIKLPTHNNKAIILIPNNLVSHKFHISVTSFYTKSMLEFYGKQVVADPSSGLVKILKNGVIKELRKEIRKKYPLIKTDVIKFIYENEELYELYKKKQLNYIDLNNL